MAGTNGTNPFILYWRPSRWSEYMFMDANGQWTKEAKDGIKFPKRQQAYAFLRSTGNDVVSRAGYSQVHAIRAMDWWM